ncbi:MAG: hypothetical protein LBQ32_11170, partial [Burkholderiaceae bacterium]|nr:hypothetical protein [Burkholderiaceae bacterium]
MTSTETTMTPITRVDYQYGPPPDYQPQLIGDGVYIDGGVDKENTAGNTPTATEAFATSTAGGEGGDLVTQGLGPSVIAPPSPPNGGTESPDITPSPATAGTTGIQGGNREDGVVIDVLVVHFDPNNPNEVVGTTPDGNASSGADIVSG